MLSLIPALRATFATVVYVSDFVNKGTAPQQMTVPILRCVITMVTVCSSVQLQTHVQTITIVWRGSASNLVMCATILVRKLTLAVVESAKQKLYKESATKMRYVTVQRCATTMAFVWRNALPRILATTHMNV